MRREILVVGAQRAVPFFYRCTPDSITGRPNVILSGAKDLNDFDHSHSAVALRYTQRKTHFAYLESKQEQLPAVITPSQLGVFPQTQRFVHCAA